MTMRCSLSHHIHISKFDLCTNPECETKPAECNPKSRFGRILQFNGKILYGQRPKGVRELILIDCVRVYVFVWMWSNNKHIPKWKLCQSYASSVGCIDMRAAKFTLLYRRSGIVVFMRFDLMCDTILSNRWFYACPFVMCQTKWRARKRRAAGA